MPSSTLTSTKLSVRDVSCSLLRVNGNDIDTNFDAATFISNLDLSFNGLGGDTIDNYARVINSNYVSSTNIFNNQLNITLSDSQIDTNNYSIITTDRMYATSDGNLNFSDSGAGVSVGVGSDENIFNEDVRAISTITAQNHADAWPSYAIGFRCRENGGNPESWYGYLYCRGYQYRNMSWVAAGNRRWHICCDLVIQAQHRAHNVTRYSDRRLKKNIVPIKNAMESINKLKIVHYIKTHPAGGRKKEIGVIAQEVEATNDLNLIRSVRPPMTKDDYYNVEYAQLHYIAIKAFQELHDEYEKFKEEKNKKLLHLMERITALENKKNEK
tara:strand:- start:432 stop:1412 length:981 start_codon:yes stop_codon:yes gene_type:complete